MKKLILIWGLLYKVCFVLLFYTPLTAMSQPVNSWITTGDQTKLLQKCPAITFSNGTSSTGTILTVDTNTIYQEMDGFGFCLTEGSAEVISSLSSSTQDALLNELFNNSTGIGISVLRISIGASDLSSYSYSYDDLTTGTDVGLTKFSLAGPDLTYLVPVLKKILLINPNIKIMGSPWSAPKWMKTKNSWVGGSLNTNYYAAYAAYFVKYLDAMKALGINIWAVTPQNEPENPNNEPSMTMTSLEQKNFINNNLGPALVNAGYQTKIIAFDHNCDNTSYPIDVCNNSTYVDGAAFHLYAGSISALSTVHTATGKNVYFTEQYTAINSSFAGTLSSMMGNVMIGSTKNWAKIALEWNLATNAQFGPYTPGGCNTCQGAITINNNVNYNRNVSYYIAAHMSKFVKPGARRIHSVSSYSKLQNVAFKNPDGSIALILMNTGTTSRVFNVNYGGKTFSYTLSATSAASIVWSGSNHDAIVLSTPNQSISMEINNQVTIPVNVSGAAVSKIEFYNGTDLMATDTSLPYDYTWTPLAKGIYSITCKAYDVNGMYANSLIISLNVIEYRPVPGTIQSEDYDLMSGVLLEACSDLNKGLDVGYNDPNDFMQYNVNVLNKGTYKVDFRVAGAIAGSFQLLNSGASITGPVKVPVTGGYQTWKTISDTVILNPGKQTIRFQTISPGWNINYMVFSFMDSITGITTKQELPVFSIYPNPGSDYFYLKGDFSGNEIGSILLLNSLGETLKENTYGFSFEKDGSGALSKIKINAEALSTGFYFLKVQVNGFPVYQKIIKN